MLNSSYRKALRFGAFGAAGGAIGNILGGLLLEVLGSPDKGTLLVTMGDMAILFGLIGFSIALGLFAGYTSYVKRELRPAEAIRIAGFGLLAGALAGGISQFMFFLAQISSGSPQGQTTSVIEFARIICWGICGGILGYGLSFQIPNLGRTRGSAGGAVGGLTGGLIYVLFKLTSGEAAGGIFGIAAIGFCIGVVIILAETLFRKAWLEITYGPKEVRVLTLGDEPISIGSDQKSCTIYARGVPPVAYRFKFQNGKISCDDVSNKTTTYLQPGDSKLIGNITASVRAAGNSATSQMTPQPPATPIGTLSLRLPGRVIPLHPGTQLYRVDIPGLEPRKPGEPIAEVVRNPWEPNVLGLKNLSDKTWSAGLPNGTPTKVDIGQSIKLTAGTRVQFGSAEGLVEG